MTNESKCVLAANCTLAGNPDACHDRCPHFNALHAPAGRHSNAQMPPEYELYTVANNPVRDAQPAVYKLVDQYVKTFGGSSRSERIKSLYLYSAEPGTGKTSTACALLNAYITAHYLGSLKRGVQPEQRPAYFAKVNRLQQTYNNMTRPGGREAQESAGNEYRRELSRLTKDANRCAR